MNKDHTIAEITRLHHFLIDVWDWNTLHDIGYDLLTAHLVREPGDDVHRDWNRQADAQLTEHLASRYATAAAEIDRTIPLLPPSELLDALLEQLHAHLVKLSNIEVSFREWYDRNTHPDTDHFERDPAGRFIRSEAETREAERQHFTRQREAWRCVSDELAFYISKLAAKIDRVRTADHSLTTPSSAPRQRIQWTPSTAAYVHLVKELLTKGYIHLPAQNGKDGEGNVTELFRRLAQAFHVTGRNDQEVTPEELQRRFNGRALANSKAAKLNLPEADEL
jgi:hypothetical protein